MTAGIIGGVSLVVILTVLWGWRRSAKRVGELTAENEILNSINEQQLKKIKRLAAAPPGRDEQSRMLRKISAAGGND